MSQSHAPRSAAAIQRFASILAVAVAGTMVLPTLLIGLTASFVAVAGTASAHSGDVGSGGGHGHKDGEAAQGFWNAVEGFTTKTGFRLVFAWDVDAPIAGIVEWGYAPNALTNVVRPFGDAVDSAQIAITDIPRADVVPGKTVHFRVRDQVTGMLSPVKTFPLGNAWRSDTTDGVYEINAILQVDTEAMPEDVPIDQGMRELGDAIKVMAERIWDATDGYVRVGKIIITDTNVNYPVNVPLGTAGICPATVDVGGVTVQHTLADFLIETVPPFDSHTWGPNPMIDTACTGFYVGRAGWLVANAWRDDLDLGAVMAHELGHYAFGLDDLYTVPGGQARNCLVGTSGVPNNANGNYDITMMHNTFRWSGSRWIGSELDRANTACDRGTSGRVSWNVLTSRYTAIPSLGRTGDGYPYHGDSNYQQGRGNPNGDALEIFIMDREPGLSKINQYVKRAESGAPEVTITSPSDGEQVPPAPLTVSGIVDRQSLGGNKRPTVSLAAAPTSGPSPLSVTFSMTATDSDGVIASWSLDFGDGSAPASGTGAPPSSRSYTYTQDGVYVATLTATDDAGDATSAERTITVGIIAGERRIGTDPAGDIEAADDCGTATIPCSRGWVAGARDGLDLRAAFVADNGANIRFTVVVEDAEKFFVDPSGDPGSGSSRIVRYQLSVPFQTSPGTVYQVNIERARGGTDVTASLGKRIGGPPGTPALISNSVIANAPGWSAATDKFWVDVPKSMFPELGVLTQLQNLDASSAFVQAGETVQLIKTMDANLAVKENPTYNLAEAPNPLGLGVAPASVKAAPSAVPANPHITDPDGDVTGEGLLPRAVYPGLPIDHMDIQAAWFDNDEQYLYVGLKVKDIPLDPAATSQIAYHVGFRPQWPGTYPIPAGNTFTGLRVEAVRSQVSFNGLLSPSPDGVTRYDLQVLSTTSTGLSQFSRIGEIPLSSLDVTTDIVWFVVPRAMINNPPPLATMGSLNADIVPAVRGLVTFGTFYGDAATSSQEYTFKQTSVPLSASAGGPYSGQTGSPIALAGAGSGGAPPYSCSWSAPGGTFSNPTSCATGVVFASPGNVLLTLTVTDSEGAVATDETTVSVTASSAERVELFVGSETSPRASVPIATSAQNPQASWSGSLDLSSASGPVAIVAKWLDADGALLDDDTVSVTVTTGGAAFVTIDEPASGAVVSGTIPVSGRAGHGNPDGSTVAAFGAGGLFETQGSVVREGSVREPCVSCESARGLPARLAGAAAFRAGPGAAADGVDGRWLDVSAFSGAEYALASAEGGVLDVWFFADPSDLVRDAKGSHVGAVMPKHGVVPPGANWAFVYLRRPGGALDEMPDVRDVARLTLTLPLSAPAALASASQASAVRLSWLAPVDSGASDVSSYLVYRDGRLLATVPAGTTSYLDETVAPATVYRYSVSAVNARGEGPRAGPVAGAAGSSDIVPPGVPLDLAVVHRGARAVTLTWSAASDNVAVDHYRVYRGNELVGTATGTSYTEFRLTPATLYAFRVSAVDAAGNEGLLSSIAEGRTLAASTTTETVTLTLDGEHLETIPVDSSAGTATWSTTLDTTTLTNGVHTLVASYDDGVGGSDTASVSFEVANDEPVEPTVGITHPSEGESVLPPFTFRGDYSTGTASAATRGGSLDSVVDPILSGYVANDEVLALLRSPTWATDLATLQALDGYLAAAPLPDGRVTVGLSGARPDGAPATTTDGRSILYVENVAALPLVEKAGAEPAPGAVVSLQDYERGIMPAAPSGPIPPSVQQGVGPGGAIQMANRDPTDGVVKTYICTASYLYEHPTNGKYYLATAGHCLLDGGSGNSATNPSIRSRWVRVCIQNCVNNYVSLGQYVQLEPNSAYDGYHPVAYAAASGIGSDFGFIEIPPSLAEHLRSWLWFWTGPTRYQRPVTADPIVHYGHGVGIGGSLATQGRVALTASSNLNSVNAVGWAMGGDSGSAFGRAAPRADRLVIGDAASGVLTHAIVGVGVPLWWGTTLERGLAMASPSLGFTARLVLEDATIRVATAPPPTPLAATIATPASGSTVDKSTTPSVAVTGAATFPAASGPGAPDAFRTYFLHRTGPCGATLQSLWMDLTKSANPESGNGCGHPSARQGTAPVFERLIGEVIETYPAKPRSASPIHLDTARAASMSLFVGPYTTNGMTTPVSTALTYDLEVRVTMEQGGVTTLVGTDRQSGVAEPGATTEIVFSFTPQVAVVPAGANLAVSVIVREAAPLLGFQYGGAAASNLRLPLGTPPTREIQVAVDDATFGPSSRLLVTGTTSWSATWPVGSVPDGSHTIYARAVQDGVASPTTMAAVTVTGSGGVGPTADFSFVIDHATLEVAFTDLSTPGDAAIASRAWTFGDGGSSTATDPVHTYAQPGEYTVTLLVTDANGLQGSASRTIQVAPPADPPTAAFTWVADGLTVTFTDLSVPGGAPITSWEWSFGDGATSTEQHPVHTYAAPGSYFVGLVVMDQNDAGDNAVDTVTVEETGATWVVEIRLDGPSGEAMGWTTVATAADGDAGTWSRAWAPATTPPPGDYTLQARLLRDGATMATAARGFVVPDANVAPTVSAGLDQEAGELQLVTLQGSASDANGDALTVQWTQVSGPSVALSGADTLTASFTTPDRSQDETYVFRLTASDGEASASDDVAVVVRDADRIAIETVDGNAADGVTRVSGVVAVAGSSSLAGGSSPNQAPVAVISGVAVSGLSVAASGAASYDPDGSIVSYAWSLGNGDGVTGVDLAYTYPEAGTYVLTLTVTDDAGASAQDAVMVTVEQAPPPSFVADAGDSAFVRVDGIVTLSGRAFGATGDVAYSWDTNGDGVPDVSGQATQIPAGSVVGPRDVTLHARDVATGEVATDTVRIVVYSPQVTRYVFQDDVIVGINDEDTPAGSGSVDQGTLRYPIAVMDGAERLDAFLTWTRYEQVLQPGNPSGVVGGPNDFDLYALSPGHVQDTRDASFQRPERLAVLDPTTGTWRIEVRPYAVVDDRITLMVNVSGAPPSPLPTLSQFGQFCFETETPTLTVGVAGGLGTSVAWDFDMDGLFDDASGTSVTGSFATGPHLARVRATTTDGVRTTMTFAFRVADDCTGAPPVVVIAIADTGINPYNREFAGELIPYPALKDYTTMDLDAPGPKDVAVYHRLTGELLPFTRHPSTYIPGFPADAPPLKLTLGGGYYKSLDDATVWNRGHDVVKFQEWMWIPGTKIIAAMDATDDAGRNGAADPTPLFDDHGHGTWSAGVAAGNAVGTCPRCVIAFIESLNDPDFGYRESWIDFVSISGSPLANLGFPDGGRDVESRLGRIATERGQTISYAAGNGALNMFESPEQTYLSSSNGPDWTLTVGAVQKSGTGNAATGASVLTSGKPVDWSSFGAGNIPTACRTNYGNTCQHSGTSSATPLATGVMAEGLLNARIAVGDTRSGQKAAADAGGKLQAVAVGAPVAGSPWLADGVLQRHEMWHVALHCAVPLSASPVLLFGTGPATPADFAYAGYGVANSQAADCATAAYLTGAAVPQKLAADLFFEVDEVIRDRLWGDWDGDADGEPGGNFNDLVPLSFPSAEGIVAADVESIEKATALIRTLYSDLGLVASAPPLVETYWLHHRGGCVDGATPGMFMDRTNSVGDDDGCGAVSTASVFGTVPAGSFTSTAATTGEFAEGSTVNGAVYIDYVRPGAPNVWVVLRADGAEIGRSAPLAPLALGGFGALGFTEYAFSFLTAAAAPAGATLTLDVHISESETYFFGYEGDHASRFTITGVSGGGGGDLPTVAIASPVDGTDVDKSAGTLEVSGTATFPPQEASTPTKAFLRYAETNGACGPRSLQLVDGPDDGDGCSKTFAALGGFISIFDDYPANFDPVSLVPNGRVTGTLYFDTDGVDPSQVLVLLRGDGVVLGSQRITFTHADLFGIVGPIAVEVDFRLEALTSTDPIEALVFEIHFEQQGPIQRTSHEPPGVSFIMLPFVADDAGGSDVVEVAIDDPSFGSGTLLVTGTTSWSATWDLASVTPGPHTVYARARSGDLVGALESVAVTVTEEDVTPPPRVGSVQVQAVPAGTVPAEGGWIDAAYDASTGAWSYDWNTDGLSNGETEFHARLRGDGVEVARDTLVVSLDNPKAPVLDPVGDQTVAEGETLDFVLTATDENGDALTFSAANLPTGATFDAAQARFTWTPTFEQEGVYTGVVFTVTDGTASDSETITITVEKTNRAPLVKKIPTKTVKAEKTLTFTVEATDPDAEDTITYSATGLPAGATLDPQTGVFTWTPTAEQQGDHVVTFTATDGVASDDETVTIKVLPPNRKPQMSGGSPQNVNESEPASSSVTATDPDGDPVTMAAADLPAGATFDVETGEFAWTPTFEQAGVYTIVITASDGELTETLDLVVTVVDVNRAPVLEAPTSALTDEGLLLQFATQADDPDGDPVELVVDGLPDGASFEDGLFEWTPAYGQAGTYTVTVTATDGDLATSTTVDITVREVNTPPVLTPIEAKTVLEAETLTFTVEATDAEGNALTFSASGLPDGATFVGETFTWTPTYDQAGTHAVTFTVSDGTLTDSEVVVVTVVNVNRAPVLASIGAKTVAEDSTLSIVPSASDPDADGLTYTATGLPTGALFSGSPRTFTWKPTFDQAGVYTVTFTATDGDLSASEAVVITVTDLNRAPVASFTGPAIVAKGASASFAGTATDPDGDALTWLYDFGDGGTSDRQSPSHAFAAGGTYTVTLVVTDAKGAAATSTRTIVVDGAAPTSAAAVTGPSTPDGWYDETARVALSATDEGGAGLRSTKYALNANTLFTTYSTPIALPNGEAEHTVKFYSDDTVGNTEAQKVLKVKVDTVAPNVRLTMKRPTDVLVTPAVLSASATDAGSGVGRVDFLVDGAVVCSDTDGTDGWSCVYAPVGLDAGRKTVTAAAFDRVGHRAEDSVAVLVVVAPDGGEVVGPLMADPEAGPTVCLGAKETFVLADGIGSWRRLVAMAGLEDDAGFAPVARLLGLELDPAPTAGEAACVPLLA